MTIAIASTIATPMKARPAIRNLLADSTMNARSDLWKRMRWVALGAIRQINEAAVASNVA